MDSNRFKDLLASLNTLLEHVELQLDHIHQEAPAISWASLEWTAEGASALFEQFKIAGAWNENITATRLELEQAKQKLVGEINHWKIDIDKRTEASLARNSKKYIMQSMAIQERLAMAKIDVGDDAYVITLLENKLDVLNSRLNSLKDKANQYASFKADAKIAMGLMNFGNQLGELK